MQRIIESFEDQTFLTPVRPMTTQEVEELRRFLDDGGPTAAKYCWETKEYGDTRVSAVRHVLPTLSESVHCIVWEGQVLMTGYDLMILLRLLIIDNCNGALNSISGIAMKPSQFQQIVQTVLEQHYSDGTGYRTEEANGDLIKWLHRHGCVGKATTQKVYDWKSLDIQKLTKRIREECSKQVPVHSKVKKETHEPSVMIDDRTELVVPDEELEMFSQLARQLGLMKH